MDQVRQIRRTSTLRQPGLDFLAITEHNHAEAGKIANNPGLYSGTGATSLISRAKQFTKDGQFVAIYGQEFSTIKSGNHMNVFEVPTVIDVANGRFDLLLNEWLPAHLDSTGQEAILLLNHPALSDSPVAVEYGRDDFPTVPAWIGALDKVARLINIINGPSHTPGTGLQPGSPSESEFKRYLGLGFHLAPTADQDNHKENWGDATEARTAVIAPSLTKANILAAMRARNVYATEDRNLKVIGRVNNQLIGSRITGTSVPAPNTSIMIRIQLSDPDEPAASYTVRVFAGTIGGAAADAVRTAAREGDGDIQVDDVQYTGGNQYFYFKISQRNDDDQEDRVWTAPVWFEPGVGTPPVIPAILTLNVDRVGETATIANVGGQSISVGSWTLRSVRGDQRFTIPAGTALAAGGTLIVRSGPSAVGNNAGTLNWTTNFIWNNNNDPAELIDTAMTIVAEDEQ